MGIVYAIRHAPTGRTYVGSTRSSLIQRASTHRYHLRRGTHGNLALQAAWADSGEGAFAFVQLEPVANAAHLHAVEQSMLDFYRSRPAGTFNTPGSVESTRGHIMGAETRARRSKAHTGRPRTPAELAGIQALNVANRRPVEALDPDTLEVVHTFESVSAVKRQGLSVSNVTGALRGRLKTSGGFLWRYKYTTNR